MKRPLNYSRVVIKEDKMNRRQILLGALGVLVTPATAFARSNRVRYNFNTGSRIRYRGKERVTYQTSQPPGSIVVNTKERALYFILGGGQAIRYGVGVGRQGFEWKGAARIRRKAKWPAWHPPEAMRIRELKQYGRKLPRRMEGGPNNPLGARALYLYQGKRDTLYRIHGTNKPSSIGRADSSGCIRMLNDEVVELYQRVEMGAKVIVT